MSFKSGITFDLTYGEYVVVEILDSDPVYYHGDRNLSDDLSKEKLNWKSISHVVGYGLRADGPLKVYKTLDDALAAIKNEATEYFEKP